MGKGLAHAVLPQQVDHQQKESPHAQVPHICTQLQTIKDVKHLGVTISSDLSWNKHVDNTVKKATTSLNFLKRNLCVCPAAVKDKCYKSIVRPHFDPHTQRKKTNWKWFSEVRHGSSRATLIGPVVRHQC